jgi:hypothetical protein
MADANLNSMHLEWPRREAFRYARQGLLECCGEYTQLGRRPNQDSSAASVGSHTIVQNLENRLPADLPYGLMDREAIYPLKVGINTIGRMPDNDVIVEDPHVSRRHCAIVVHATDGFEIHDVASKNGTYVNGIRLTGPTHLASGDEIRMCDRQMVFVSRFDSPKGHRPSATLSR